MWRHVNLFIMVVCTMVFLLAGVSGTMAIEEASYTVEVSNGQFELRLYEPQVVAETVVDGPLEAAGNRAFKVLFSYISGENRSRVKVDMTAPVSQQALGERIPMTAPVGQQPAGNGDKWLVSFLMPSGYAIETLPEPKNPDVRLREVPERRMAVIRYSGTWSKKRYIKNRMKLENWMEDSGLKIAGEPIWARYNPPFTPWFMRRNEILVPIDDDV